MQMGLEEKLQSLVDSGTVKSFKLENVDEEGNVGQESKCRNTERLTITFPSGEELVIGTFCSGCLENTVFTAD